MNLTDLRRRPDRDRPDCWQVYSGDIRAGHIAKATGINGVTHWSWSAGFYPGSRPGEIRCGTAKTYELAKIAFERAWQVFASTRTETGSDDEAQCRNSVT